MIGLVFSMARMEVIRHRDSSGQPSSAAVMSMWNNRTADAFDRMGLPNEAQLYRIIAWAWAELQNKVASTEAGKE